MHTCLNNRSQPAIRVWSVLADVWTNTFDLPMCNKDACPPLIQQRRVDISHQIGLRLAIQCRRLSTLSQQVSSNTILSSAPLHRRTELEDP